MIIQEEKRIRMTRKCRIRIVKITVHRNHTSYQYDFPKYESEREEWIITTYHMLFQM